MFNCTGQNVMAMSYALSTYLIQNYSIDELAYISNVLLLIGQQVQTAIAQEEFCQILRRRGTAGATVVPETQREVSNIEII
ncbi:MAG: hypothetical protein RR048_03235, partial [Oscillospiraceae bacterium]